MATCLLLTGLQDFNTCHFWILLPFPSLFHFFFKVVGLEDGTEEGDADGCLVGIVDSAEDGNADGIEDGDADGIDDGIVVGGIAKQ